MDSKEVLELKETFFQTSKILEAIASNVRQEILLNFAAIYPNGLRIGEIKMKKCIARPSMSHHIKVLYKAELLRCQKVGQKNYYFLSIQPAKLNRIEDLIHHLKNFIGEDYASN